MALLDIRGGYLYQHRPDLFPGGMISETETALWSIYYQDKKNNQGSS